jgi:hypothetical protein
LVDDRTGVTIVHDGVEGIKIQQKRLAVGIERIRDRARAIDDGRAAVHQGEEQGAEAGISCLVGGGKGNGMNPDG